jgi:cell wall-associated NlpC family hydrolase
MGLPYRWGGNGPDAYDCSGLMEAAWRAAGVALPRVAQDQHDHLRDVHGQGAPGDLVFYGTGPTAVSHVGMWIRSGVLLDAPFSGAVVRLEPMDLAEAVSVGSVD